MSEKTQKDQERLIQEVKDCGQDLINRAEEFVGSIDMMTDFDIVLNFSVTGESVPFITINKGYYPKTTLERYWKGENND